MGLRARSFVHLATASIVLMAAPAAADPVAEFYKGKQIRVVIRAAPGGNYDLYSRLLIRHMVRHIPGHPAGLPVNMPGGSGLTALNYVADVHPPDGTVLTMVTQTFPLEQALGGNAKLRTDMRRLNWIGNMSDANSFLLTSRTSQTRTLADAKRRETIIGVPSVNDASAWLTLVTNGTLGTRFKLVPGYTSGPNMNLAMERGEIEGRGTSNPRALFTGGGQTGPDGKPLFNLILQWGLTKDQRLFRGAAVARACRRRGPAAGLRFRFQRRLACAPARDQCRGAAGTGRGAAPRFRRDHAGRRVPGGGEENGDGDQPDGW